MRKLYTIGYEGADLDNFLKTLVDAKVNILLDVRELPISRRKGFSKSALMNALAEVGIEYRHEKQLGSPKAIRHRLREDWDYRRFFRDFDRHLDKQSELIEILAQELKGNIALMCYERDHEDCHRRSVADALADLANKTPVHLGVNDNARNASDASHSHSRKSISPA